MPCEIEPPAPETVDIIESVRWSDPRRYGDAESCTEETAGFNGVTCNDGRRERENGEVGRGEPTRETKVDSSPEDRFGNWLSVEDGRLAKADSTSKAMM